MPPIRSIRSRLDGTESASHGRSTTPSLKAIDPAAARWINSLIRISSSHPAMGRVLDVIERLQDRPYRTNALVLGEAGTGKDGLARALHQLTAARGPLVRLDVAGFPESEALEALCGQGRRPGAAEAAHNGTLVIEELLGLPLRVQEALLRLLKAGRSRRIGQTQDVTRRLSVQAIALSDGDVERAVAEGRLRHDLYYRLARVVLWLPPLRERIEDLAPSAVWMGNRLLTAAHVPLELRTPQDLERASAMERKRAIALTDSALDVLRSHTWPGNFRELEAVLERALLLYRQGPELTDADVRAALAPPVISR